MSNEMLLVVIDNTGAIVAVADPSRTPAGMSYSLASNQGHSVHEVHVQSDVMQRPRDEMKRIILERMRVPGASKPHIARRAIKPGG
jgi:hypothetical protein